MATQTDNPIINHIAAVAQSQASNKQASIDIATQMDAQQAAYSDAEMSQAALGAGKQAIISAQETLLAARDAKAAAIRTQFGADPTELGSQSNKWLTEMQQNADKAYAALDVVREKQSHTLLSDPLSFIQAQFTLPADIAEHNYWASKHNQAEANLNEVTSASDANVIAANRAAATTSTELAIAKGEEAAQTANYNIAQLKEQAAGTRIKGIETLNGLTAQKASMALALHQSANSDKGLQLQEQAHKDMMEDRALRRAQVVKDNATEADNLQAQEDMRKQFNANARRNNQAEIPDQRTWRTVATANAKNPDFWSKIAAGQQIVANSGSAVGVPVASSAGHAALVYANGGTNFKLDPVAQFLFDKLETVKATPGASKDPEAVASAVTAAAIGEATRLSKRIDPNSPNIYVAPPPAVILNALGPAQSDFVQKTIAPLVAANPKLAMNDDVIMAKAFDYAGTLPRGIDAAAAGIKAYYDQAVLNNTVTKQFVEKGLPAQVKYPALIEGKVVDLTDLTAIKTAIIRHTIGEANRNPGMVSFN
jgi:hypothetical protein